MFASFHLLETTVPRGVRLLARRRARTEPDGPVHSEPMALMELGAPVVSRRRLQVRRLAHFAVWEDEGDLDRWLAHDTAGRQWAAGWHVRLQFLRRWGNVTGLEGLTATAARHDLDEPVVAITLARLRLTEVPRFIEWGRPVEVQVRDDPGQVLAVAAAAPPRTVSTFTVWRSARAMTDMVAGRSGTVDATRHATAMHERDRRDFHFEFTTLRFRCLTEHGTWQGRSDIVPPRRIPSDT